MRKLILSVLLVSSLVSIALAANDQRTAVFEGLQASGITGEARLNPMPQGEVKIHESLRGLLPNTTYVTRIYQNGSCASGGTTFQIATFTSNPAGNAQINTLVNLPIESIESLSVELASDNTVVACAPVQ